MLHKLHNFQEIGLHAAQRCLLQLAVAQPHVVGVVITQDTEPVTRQIVRQGTGIQRGLAIAGAIITTVRSGERDWQDGRRRSRSSGRVDFGILANTDHRIQLGGRRRFVRGHEMLLDDTVHFTLCIRREALKAEADSEGRVGRLGAETRWGLRDPGADQIIWVGSAASGAPGSWVPGVSGISDGEAQCRYTTQEFGASLEVKAGAVSAEVGRERFEPVIFPGRICEIKLDWELWHTRTASRGS